MAATWSDKVARVPRVLVPVQLDVMMIRQDGEIAADCEMTTPPDRTTNMHRLDLLPAPFKNHNAPRVRGAYLHWALPDGLTHVTTDGTDGNTQHYAVPDRWLILRLSPSSVARRAVRGWVLRTGDKIAPPPADLATWVETGPAADLPLQQLNAMGNGDPAWAAYYDNVVNRLGFWDGLLDVSEGPIAYLVCGWYSEPQLDPLGDPNIQSLNDFNSKLGQFNWAVDPADWQPAVDQTVSLIKAANLMGLRTQEYAGVATKSVGEAGPLTLAIRPHARVFPPQSEFGAAQLVVEPAPLDDSGLPAGGTPYTMNGTWWPTATLYHGAAVGIGWPDVGWLGNESGLLGSPERPGAAGGEFGGPPPASHINVAVGNTMTEALGALVANANKSPSEARILEAYLLGALSELDKPDGQAHVDDLLHQTSFLSRDGGYEIEQVRQPGNAATATAPPSPVANPDPGIFGRRRRFLGAISPLVTGAQQTAAFAPQAFSNVLDNVRGKAQTRIAVSVERSSENEIIKGDLTGVMASIGEFEAAPALPAGQTIAVKRALPRYFQPADPVFLVQGGGRSFKHGGDTRFSQDNTLICRLTGFCVTELSCSAVTGAPNRPSITGDDLIMQGVENGSVPLECEDLLREVVLIDPGSALVAAQSSTSFTGAQLQEQARRFMVEQTVWWATRDIRIDPAPLVSHSGITGTLPSPIAVSPPVRPWNPIHLDWEVGFISTGGPSRIPVPDTPDWSLDEIDFVGTNPPAAATVSSSADVPI
jgi:hypothetical protein